MGRSLSFLDKSFWLAESDASPKHVGCVQILEMPEQACASEYVRALYEEVKSHTKITPPFNCKVKTLLGYPLGLQPVKHMDMDYHVQFHITENIQDRRQLDKLTETLHASRLDPEKPLWQFIFLHDNTSRQFVIYARVHHLYGDGATLVRWFQAGYTAGPAEQGFTPVWALKRLRHRRKHLVRWRDRLFAVWQGLKTSWQFFIIMLRLLMKLVRINTHYMPLPFSGTQTPLTGQVRAGRAVTTTDIDFAEIKALARRTRASANEILLCVFDIAVHRFLNDHGQRFTRPLYTNMPVNLRKPGEKTTGNKIAIVPVELAHGERDPYVRLRQIIVNHRIVKHAAQKATPGAFKAYTITIQAVSLVFEWLHLSDFVKPIANILISNLPGPKETRYLKDSKLLACYPVSTMTPGGGVNITLMTYNGTANVGIVCCNRHVKDISPLAGYVHEALAILARSLDEPGVGIEDIGEQIESYPRSVIAE